MGIKVSEFRVGQGVKRDNQIWTVWSIDHVVKGKGQSYYQIELRNCLTGQIIGNRYRTSEQFEPVHFDRKKMQFLYSDQNSHVFMDNETYEQIELPLACVGDKSVYLTDSMECEICFCEGQLISAELPNTVELTVEDTPPQVKGATATNQLKTAVCQGGAVLKVPPFVENGTVVKVDTRNGEYLGRA